MASNPSSMKRAAAASRMARWASALRGRPGRGTADMVLPAVVVVWLIARSMRSSTDSYRNSLSEASTLSYDTQRSRLVLSVGTSIVRTLPREVGGVPGEAGGGGLPGPGTRLVQ